MKKLITSLVLLVSVAITAIAQSPKEVLDKTASRLEQAGTAHADFRLTAYDGRTKQGESVGNIDIKGDKIYLTTPELAVWYDGTTQWSLNKANNEVNIQEPTDEELATMNPYAFISLYRQGYAYKMKRVQYENLNTYEVTLTAKSKNAELSVIVVNINPNTFTPMRIRLKQDNNWAQINITNLKLGAEISDNAFVFPSSQYPQATIVDLR